VFDLTGIEPAVIEGIGLVRIGDGTKMDHLDDSQPATQRPSRGPSAATRALQEGDIFPANFAH